MITFIIPAFNAEKTLGECIASIVSQDVNKEIIVVDNGSIDATVVVANRYNIRCVVEKKKGPASARNAGLEVMSSDSKYIAFIDADVVLPTSQWARKAINMLDSDKTIAGIGGGARSKEKNWISENLDILLYGRVRNSCCYVKNLATMDVVYKYSIVQSLRFNEQLYMGEDPDFNFRIISKGWRLLYSDDLWVYHCHPLNLVELLRKWFKYGIYYPLPYIYNKIILVPGLWARLLYMPVTVIAIAFLATQENFVGIFAVITVLPLIYAGLGIKAGIQGIGAVIAFSLIHSAKQSAQIAGIWYGIVLRTIRRMI